MVPFPAMKSEIEQALRRHLARHAELIGAGDERLGWKVAFNAPPVQERLGLSHSLVAGLRRSSILDPSRPHSLAGGTRVGLEAEVAVALRRDVRAGDEDTAIESAIEGIGPAIEVIDIDRSFDELAEIIAEGVFHRGVVFGEMQPAPPHASLAGIRAHVELDGKEVADLDAGAATGRPVDVLRLVARILEPLGEALRAGDRIILGSMNVPPPARAGADFALALTGWPKLRLEFED